VSGKLYSRKKIIRQHIMVSSHCISAQRVSARYEHIIQCQKQRLCFLQDPKAPDRAKNVWNATSPMFLNKEIGNAIAVCLSSTFARMQGYDGSQMPNFNH